MPSFLESGKLRLSPEEAANHRAAARRLHATCEMVVDLTQPIDLDDWVLVQLASAALAGDVGLLESAIAKVETEIQSRRQRD
jgi:hypothetical protein